MADRRMGDRRELEQGVVKIEIKKVVIYVIIAIVLIVSITLNIIFGIQCSEYKNKLEEINNRTEAFNVEENNSYIGDDYINYSCDLLVTGDKQQLKAGDVITYEITAKNINADTGIIMFETLLDYDTNLFECEVVNDENSEWELVAPSNSYLSMSRKNLLPSKEDQSIIKLAVKVKENVKSGNYAINLIGSKFTMENYNTFVISEETIEVNVV